MEQADWQKWFEGIWADREERIYRELLGSACDTIHTIPAQTFASLGKGDPDPRFLTHGVLEYSPTAARAFHVYITSGMSNPWGESPETVSAESLSGLGFEFLLCTRAAAPWAIGVLQWLMAVQLLVAAGDLQGQLLELDDRIPLGGLLPRGGEAGGPGLSNLLVTEPAAPLEIPRQFSMASGKVDLMLVIGITEREAEFARTQGSPALVNLLKHRAVFPCTDPVRLSLV